jgi:hypothetical protein
MSSFTLVKGITVCVLACGLIGSAVRAADTQVPVTFSGGHDTDRRDGGRPVVLIAAALGVTPAVFREAFSGVTPAKNGRPSGDEARRNKEALLKVLEPYGVTNERLDEVSDYYRYRPQNNELWRNSPAKAHAVVEGGKVKRIVVTDGGAGYTTPPKAIVKGLERVELTVALQFGKDLKTNGGVKAIEVAAPKLADPER